MQSILVGSGWHPQLFIAEMSALLGIGEPIEGTDRMLISDDEITKSKLDYSATLDDLLQPASCIRIDSNQNNEEVLKVAFRDWLETIPQSSDSGSVAVRSVRHGKRVEGWSPTELAGHLGGVLSNEGWTIDLETPEIEIGLVVNCQTGLVAWGISNFTESPRNGWKDRSPTQRPFFKPISLDPRHARLMLNLLQTRAHVLDPLCGTGGISIEASMMGIASVAIDLDPEMMQGAMQNFEWSMENGGTGNIYPQLGDATDLVGTLDSRLRGTINGVCVDPPYGRNSWRSEDAQTLFIRVCDSARQVVEEGSYLACMLPCEGNDDEIVYGKPWDQIREEMRASGWGVKGKWTIPVHSSMSRVLILAQTE